MIKCKRTFKYIITNIKFGSLRKYQAELPDSKFLQQNLEFAPEVRGLQLPPNPLCRTHTPKLPFSEVVLSAWNVPKQHCFRFIKHVSPLLLSPLYIQKATKIPRNKAQTKEQKPLLKYLTIILKAPRGVTRTAGAKTYATKFATSPKITVYQEALQPIISYPYNYHINIKINVTWLCFFFF